jgi:hypothetical protein
MTEHVRLIKFEHFRGLPRNEFDLRGKSLVILGTNGKGKSALVDGIEFLFSGQIARFTGSGTGSISHDEAIKNVQTSGEPKVSVVFSNSNGARGEVSRTLSSEAVDIAGPDAFRTYFEQHPRVDGFVLRRSKILDFISDQDADRYQKFVQLLGVAKLDRLQRSFVDAERNARVDLDRLSSQYQQSLAVFADPVDGFKPARLADIYNRVCEAIEAFDIEMPEKWEDLSQCLHFLKTKRPNVNSDKIESLTRALVSLDTPLLACPTVDVEAANTLLAEIADLADSSSDSPLSTLISEGKSYLSSHAERTDCPLCEQQFDRPVEDVLERLKSRSESLAGLRSATSNRQIALNRVKRYADSITNQLERDLQHSNIFDPDTVEILGEACQSAKTFSTLIAQAIEDIHVDDLHIPQVLPPLGEIRALLVERLKAQRVELTPPDTASLEGVIILVERSIAAWQEILDMESALASSRENVRRSTVVKQAFSRAREAAIQGVFTQISATVLNYYRRLHDFGDGSEASECTDLELMATSRAAAGGLRLAIQFMGVVDSKDPRGFLSEGHLDSLGLCLFLAAVRSFNPPGSLLVLDDVLTSIDKQHRRRVGELLYSEFQDYQVIITTHDEHWHDLLCSTARAWGLQDRWRYIKLESWDVDSGPSLSVVDSSWGFISENLTEANYRNLGGPLRLVIEDFMKRCAEKIELKIKFKTDGKYTGGDFVAAGLQDKIREQLTRLDGDNKIDICQDIGKVFGQGDFINFLSHDNPGRLEVTIDQARDFVDGLRSLTERCQAHRLIRGR